jgi:hypothetical protein
MTPTTIQVLQRASALGLRLGFEPPETLTFQPANRCPRDFVPLLQEHKPWLLALLRHPFVMVYSKALEEIVFFCEDENTKAMLARAGADPLSIYTRAELDCLAKANRIAPLTIAEPTKLNEIKRTFNATIADEI